MPDFDGAHPPKQYSNPTNDETPRASLYKFASDAGDTSIVVAWKGKQPIHNDVLVTVSADEKAAALADGWSPLPVLDAPKKK